MTYELYRYVFIGGLVLAIIMLLATVVIFFLFDIKNVIGDLTGVNARKGIENIRQGNEPKPKKPKKSATGQSAETTETEKISLQDRYDSMDGGQTELLDIGGEQTSVLSRAQAAVGASSTIDGNGANTAELSKGTPINPNFVVITDITYVHSGEIIQ